MATKIGCDNLAYAIMDGEDTPNKPPEYGEVTRAPGVMSISITANSSTETLFADDGPMETATTLGQIDVEIQKNELTQQNKADLLGHQIDSSGGLVYGDSDIPPFVAIAFRTLKSNGKYRYVWLYKGKFAEPEDSNETKGDSINYQAATISGQFSKLNYSYQINGKMVRPWKYEMDEDYPQYDTASINGWFTNVRLPIADTEGT